MSYIDGMVAAVPTANKQKFIDKARSFDAVLIELGATRITESWGDEVPEGKVTDFRKAVRAKEDETVVLSFVEWPDKATRVAAKGKMGELMKTDKRLDFENSPFDGKRMIFGGFFPVIEL